MSDPNLPDVFLSALRDLIQWFKADHVPHTTLGGIAVALVAQPRATQDVDVVVWVKQERWGDLLLAGERYGFKPRLHDALDFAARSRMLLLRHVASVLDSLSRVHELAQRRQIFGGRSAYETTGR